MKTTFMRRPALAAALAAAALAACSDQGPTEHPRVGAPGAVSASVAPGTHLRLVNGGYSAPCSINVGIAFDGTNLLVSCYDNNRIDYLDPATGAVVSSATVTGVSALGALAWDEGQQKIWACSNFSDVVLIDPATHAATYHFTSQGCFDGLAYDGADNTLWSSGDVYSHVEHYATNGTLIGTFPVTALLGGTGNSGIAVGGADLYLANNGGQQIWVAPKTLGSSSLFATFPRRLEDMECDNLTFAGQQTGAIWVIDAYDREINAYAIPQGSCDFGGGGGPEEVDIDVKPYSDPNSIRLNGNGDARIAVAILTTPDFDAAAIDPATVTLGDDDGDDTPVAVKNNGTLYASLQDADGDGDIDLVVHFSRPALMANGDLSASSTELVLNGETTGGDAFRGSDAVRVLP